MREAVNAPYPRFRSPHSRGWIAAAVGLSGAALWGYVGVVLVVLAGNETLIPVWILLGCFTLPAVGAVVLCAPAAEVGVSPVRLVTALCVGGLGSIIIGGSLDSVDLSVLGLLGGQLTAGVAEETAKIALVVAVAWTLPRKTVRAGLILGLAVGFGFGAFENLGYALAPFLGDPFDVGEVWQSFGTQIVRVVSSPFGHPLWTSLFAGYVFAATRTRRFRLTPGVFVAFVGVAAVHGLWDGASGLGAATFDLLGRNDDQIGFFAGVVLSALATAVTITMWLILVRRSSLTASDEKV